MRLDLVPGRFGDAAGPHAGFERVRAGRDSIERARPAIHVPEQLNLVASFIDASQ